MRFEDMDVWKMAASLSVEVYRELSDCKQYGFRDQISRSCLSISSNIAEGFGRATDRDKRNFLNYAKGSCAEFRSQTLVGRQAGFIDPRVADRWVGASNRISAMLSGLMKYLS